MIMKDKLTAYINHTRTAVAKGFSDKEDKETIRLAVCKLDQHLTRVNGIMTEVIGEILENIRGGATYKRILIVNEPVPLIMSVDSFIDQELPELKENQSFQKALGRMHPDLKSNISFHLVNDYKMLKIGLPHTEAYLRVLGINASAL